jgi:hypothetical protein
MSKECLKGGEKTKMNKKILTSMLLCFALSFCIFPSLINAEEQSDLDRLVEEYKEVKQELDDWYNQTGILALIEQYKKDKIYIEFYDNLEKIRITEYEYEEKYSVIWDEYYSNKEELDKETGIKSLRMEIRDLHKQLEKGEDNEDIWRKIEELEEKIEFIEEEYSDEYTSIKEEYKQKEKALDEEAGIEVLRERNEEIRQYIDSLWKEINQLYEDNYASLEVILEKIYSLYDEAEELGIRYNFWKKVIELN